MNHYPEFAALLERYLLQAERSGAWVAQRVGVNPATVTRWRNGDTRPNSPELVTRLADVLGVHAPTARQQFLYAAGYGYLEPPEMVTPVVQPAPQLPATHHTPDVPLPTSRAGDYWQKFPADYRAREMQTLAQWIAAGISGAVIGLPGVGKSNLLRFLCQRPDVLRHYLPPESDTIVVVPVDLNGLLETTLSALLRLFVRAFYERRAYFSLPLQSKLIEAYQTVKTNPDVFVVQNVLRDLLFAFVNASCRVVLVLDRFDVSYKAWTPEMRDTLRSLRDAAHDTLTYIVGVGRTLADRSEIVLAHDLYRLLATHHCYVGPLSEADARNLIARRLALRVSPPTETEMTYMLALTGGYPTLLKMLCQWWLVSANKPPVEQWLAVLSAEVTMQKRLTDIWVALTQEEQQVLRSLQQAAISGINGTTPPTLQDAAVVGLLVAKGLCVQEGPHLRIFSLLFANFVTNIATIS